MSLLPIVLSYCIRKKYFHFNINGYSCNLQINVITLRPLVWWTRVLQNTYISSLNNLSFRIPAHERLAPFSPFHHKSIIEVWTNPKFCQNTVRSSHDLARPRKKVGLKKNCWYPFEFPSFTFNSEKFSLNPKVYMYNFNCVWKLSGHD